MNWKIGNMNVMDYILIFGGTLLGAMVFDKIWQLVFWLFDYKSRRRDPAYQTRIRWWEYVQRWLK